MKSHVLQFGGVEVRAPARWRDITDELDLPDPPFTLANDAAGVGVLQFSVALHSGGPSPNPSPDDLFEMVEELAKQHDLTELHDQMRGAERLRLGAASCRGGEAFMRLWYISDGTNLAKITYTCEWGRQGDEMPECEAIVRSLRFLGRR